MSYMNIWNKLKTAPLYALKKIAGGRLKGMTDIKPQWRYQVMTETFGICGIGWKYTINRVWTESDNSGQSGQFAEIDLYIKVDEKWSDAIPAVGGSMLIAQERSGLYFSDEAVKMAVTDALGTAMKMIGVASDVYMGYSDSKHTNALDPESWRKAKDPKVEMVEKILGDESHTIQVKLAGKVMLKDKKMTFQSEDGKSFYTFSTTIATKAKEAITKDTVISLTYTDKGKFGLEATDIQEVF